MHYVLLCLMQNMTLIIMFLKTLIIMISPYASQSALKIHQRTYQLSAYLLPDIIISDHRNRPGGKQGAFK